MFTAVKTWKSLSHVTHLLQVVRSLLLLGALAVDTFEPEKAGELNEDLDENSRHRRHHNEYQ